MKTYQHVQRVVFVSILGGTAGVIGLSPAPAAAETLRGTLAAQIRTQGFACDKPLSAVREAKLSKPDHAVWVLKCNNATYRVSRVPDMAATVERLR